ncbi:2-oxoadipate dioxygenase/decarboxylase family protein [Novosphingobium sp. 9]|uniref:2-oxoadipate dioxygenase/decarboxylase family protein n=1 Tax=Novosphingobium sp. 9 TaxID=2025349 RepID=UPI0021B645F0|nr:DUF1338 family protein [Novosphingobium sp. 9]
MAALIAALLEPVIGEKSTQFVLETLELDPALARNSEGKPSRAQLAWALNAALFMDLLERVPSAARYVDGVRQKGERIVSDHGALRTIDGPSGALPSGCEGMARLLAPLGYQVSGLYPLPALKMTGRAYAQVDFPEAIPQFFVSELHIDQLAPEAQGAAEAIFGTSRDPIDAAAWAALDRLAADGACSLEDGVTILRAVLSAFDRQHPAPALADYETLLAHSREGGWIATEGNAFNHATTRVPHVEALAESLREQGFAMKPSVEVSASGRVRQTAFLADRVTRPFRDATGAEIAREVPGSFYEFISRDPDPETGGLDLRFDSGNATGIFAMTRDNMGSAHQEKSA